MRKIVALLSVTALLLGTSAAYAQHPKTVGGTPVYYLWPSQHGR